jgi:amino acid transporter
VNAALTRLHRRFHSPWVANLAAGAVGIAACFIPFHLLLVLNGTGVVVMYALLCLGAIAGRRNGSTAHGPYRMPLYPLAPVLGLAALAYVLYANWMDPAVGRPSLIATLLIMLAAIGYYLLLRHRRGGSWAMTGPLTEDEG